MVWKGNFWRYLLISGLCFLALFASVIKLILTGIDHVEPAITEWILARAGDYVKLNRERLQIGVEGAFWLTKKTIELNKDSIFTSLFLIIGAPYFSAVSGKVEKILSGRSAPFTWKGWIHEMLRGINLATRNLIKQFGLILLITLFSFIPYLGILSPLFIFIVQAFYNGILMTDYALERRGVSVKESQKFYIKNRPMMFSMGLGFMFILLIPVLGWFLAPTYAIVASSLYFFKKHPEENFQ